MYSSRSLAMMPVCPITPAPRPLPRWDYGLPGMVDTAKSLADLQAKGLIKHVGLTNMVR